MDNVIINKRASSRVVKCEKLHWTSAEGGFDTPITPHPAYAPGG